jgi:hypothetical protein
VRVISGFLGALLLPNPVVIEIVSAVALNVEYPEGVWPEGKAKLSLDAKLVPIHNLPDNRRGIAHEMLSVFSGKLERVPLFVSKSDGVANSDVNHNRLWAARRLFADLDGFRGDYGRKFAEIAQFNRILDNQGSVRLIIRKSLERVSDWVGKETGFGRRKQPRPLDILQAPLRGPSSAQGERGGRHRGSESAES